jgi:acyl carrier protein
MATAQGSQDLITKELISILKGMTSGWDIELSGEIGPDTLLVQNLRFESIDMVQLVVAIAEKFALRDLPIQKLLMVDGRYVDDLDVATIVTFLKMNLNA